MIRGWTSRAAGRRRSAGQALAEFALVAPMLFVLIFGIIEAGRFVFFYEVLNNAAREGARYAIVHGSDAVCPSGPPPPGETNACDPAGDRIKQRVQEAALSLAAQGSMFTYDPVWTPRADLANPSPGDPSTGSNERGNYVTVFVDLTYQPLIDQLFEFGILPDITISAESTLVINN